MRKYADGAQEDENRCIAAVHVSGRRGQQCRRKRNTADRGFRRDFCWQHGREVYPLSGFHYGGVLVPPNRD